MKQNATRSISIPAAGDSSTGVQSVARALDLLEAFPKYGPEIGLSRMAALINLNKATAYRLLTTLEERGYVERSPEDRKYRLGVRAFELGAYFQNQLEVRRDALPHLQAIVEASGEAAFLCVREGDEALCVERVEAEHQVNIFALRVGGKQPLHCGGAPRALLVGMTDIELQAFAARTGLPALTSYTLTTLDRLFQDVHLTRRQGYVVSMNDVTLGIAAIGAPVYDYSGRVIAAVSLSGLSNTYTPERIAALAQVLVPMAKRLSRQMGYSGE